MATGRISQSILLDFKCGMSKVHLVTTWNIVVNDLAKFPLTQSFSMDSVSTRVLNRISRFAFCLYIAMFSCVSAVIPRGRFQSLAEHEGCLQGLPAVFRSRGLKTGHPKGMGKEGGPLESSTDAAGISNHSKMKIRLISY